MYKARNKRLIPRTSGGQFRKATAADLGIMGTCPNCQHFLFRYYDGDQNDPCPDPRRFRSRCYTCEPRTEAELTAEAPQEKSGFVSMLEDAARRVTE